MPVGVAILVLLAITAAGSSGDDRSKGVPVQRGAVVSTASADGNVESPQELSLGFQASGRLVEVAVSEGDRVHQGQLLARIQNDTQRAGLAAARADLDSARSRLRQTETGLTPVELAEHRRLADQSRVAVLNARRDLTDARRIARTNVGGFRRALARARVGGEQADLRVAELRAAQQRAEARLLRRRYEQRKSRRDADERALEEALARLRRAQNRSPADEAPTQQSLNRANYEISVLEMRLDTDRDDLTRAKSDLDDAVQAERTYVLEVDRRRTLLRDARRRLGDASDTLRNGIATAAQQIDSARNSLAGSEAQLEVTLAQNRVGEQVKAADVAAGMADVAQAESAVEDARQALADTELRAPTAGVVGNVNAKVGELVRPGVGLPSETEPTGPQASASTPPPTATTPSPRAGGQASTAPSPGAATSPGAAALGFPGAGGQAGQPLITLAQTAGLQFKADFSESDVARMSIGDRARVTVEAFPNRRFAAHVASIDPIPQVASNLVTYEVTLVLDGDTARVKPGMSATADVTVARVDNALTVPRTAVRSPAGARPTVTVVLPDGRVEPRLVVTGLQSDSRVQILGGVGLGERVLPTIAPPPDLVG